MNTTKAADPSTNSYVRIMEGARFGVLGNCLLNVWSVPPQPPHLAAFDALIAEITPRHAQGIVMFVVLEPGTPMPNANERREAEATYARWASSLKAVAQVVEGGNLWAVTARSVMTAMRLVQRRPYPMKVFSDAEEGAAWSAPFLTLPSGQQGDAMQLLLRELSELRSLSMPKEGAYSAG